MTDRNWKILAGLLVGAAIGITLALSGTTLNEMFKSFSSEQGPGEVDMAVDALQSETSLPAPPSSRITLAYPYTDGPWHNWSIHLQPGLYIVDTGPAEPMGLFNRTKGTWTYNVGDLAPDDAGIVMFEITEAADYVLGW